MNSFIGIGKIADTSLKGKVFKFNLALQKEKPCFVPCVIFNATDEEKDFVDRIETTNQLVWLQGRINSYEFEYQERTIRKIQVVTYAKSIRPI
jgi:hypothetical protein